QRCLVYVMHHTGRRTIVMDLEFTRAAHRAFFRNSLLGERLRDFFSVLRTCVDCHGAFSLVRRLLATRPLWALGTATSHGTPARHGSRGRTGGRIVVEFGLPSHGRQQKVLTVSNRLRKICLHITSGYNSLRRCEEWIPKALHHPRCETSSGRRSKWQR